MEPTAITLATLKPTVKAISVGLKAFTLVSEHRLKALMQAAASQVMADQSVDEDTAYKLLSSFIEPAAVDQLHQFVTRAIFADSQLSAALMGILLGRTISASELPPGASQPTLSRPSTLLRILRDLEDEDIRALIPYVEIYDNRNLSHPHLTADQIEADRRGIDRHYSGNGDERKKYLELRRKFTKSSDTDVALNDVMIDIGHLAMALAKNIPAFASGSEP